MSVSPHEVAWDRPAPHLMTVTVAESHIDLMRHVNNVHYLHWLEGVAWDHSIALGIRPEDYTRLGHGMVVHRHELDYLQPAVLGDALWLATWIIELDRLTLRRRYQFVRQRDGAPLFRGATQFVCVEIASGRPRRMPPRFTEAYSAAL